ncbi:hypothetical protein LTR08_006982 [Meristemomyces frigidus]|nr:hypothetical protein LTR08_006982 [Meristemomyces frigidus]
MDDHAPLSELCSVCYVEKPKYRCPGCKAQTCSLACYKRHQQRASCSGKRDPSAYLKKSEWATASGLDQDYNYLKGVERNIDHAGQDARDRGIGVRTAASKNVARGWRADSTLQRYLTGNNITIEHAPTGMSRQRDNQTRPTKSNRIVWTVEWVDASGARYVRHDCAESDTIVSLYDEHLSAKQSEGNKPRGSKRKIEIELMQASRVPKHGKPEVVAGGALDGVEDRTSRPKQAESNLDVGAVSAHVTHLGPDAAQSYESSANVVSEDVTWTESVDPGNTPDSTDPVATHRDVNTQEHLAHEKTQDDALATRPREEESTHKGTSEAVPKAPELHFYLWKPATSSASKVLYPLRSESTLTECLRNRTVQEYPSVVVLDSPSQSLPKGYMLHEDYIKSITDNERDLRQRAEGGRNDAPALNSGRLENETESQVLDTQSILDMLKRDVRT